jgi:ribulose-5-phosphate 4-epimerase/fuculose-1-phosphate aldolase
MALADLIKKSGISDEQYRAAKRKLAVMCRIVGIQGHIDLFGHISLRIPNTDIVLITPGAGSEKVTVRADEIFTFDLNGEIHYHPGGDHPLYIPMEWRIHTQIHKDRPELGCVAHLHARASTLLGIADKKIMPVHSRGALFENVPVWDNPRLVVNDEQAVSLSKTLGGEIACQMRGHGSVVVGKTAEQALVATQFIEENCQWQLDAEALGGARRLSADEIRDCSRGALDFGTRLWEFWERRALRSGLPL